MKKLLIAGALALFAATVSMSYASHHFEGAAFLSDTRLAQVDNFVFPAERDGYTGVAMIVNYEPKAGENGTFSHEGVYNMHFANDMTLSAGKTFSFKFDGDRYDVFMLDGPNPEPGVVGEKIGSGEIGKPSDFENQMKSYAGVARDPFFGNAIALEVFRAQNLEGTYDEGMWEEVGGESAFAERKVGALVLEIPNEFLGDKVYSYFTTSKQTEGGYEQVQFSAIPLLSHLMMFDSNLLRKAHDESRPTDEYSDAMQILVSARIARAVLLADSQANPAQYADETAAMLFPDVIPYEVGTPTEFTLDRINGRGFDEDVMSVMLSWLLGKETDQAMENPKRHIAEFPYVEVTTP